MYDFRNIWAEELDKAWGVSEHAKSSMPDWVHPIIDRAAVAAMGRVAVLEGAADGEPMDPRFIPTRRDLIALREDAASMRGAGLPVVVNVAPRVLYLAWPNGQYDHANPESSRWRCVSFNLPE